MATPPLSVEEAERYFEAVEDALKKGYPPPKKGSGGMGALRVAMKACGLNVNSATSRYNACVSVLGREPDWSLWKEPETKRTAIPAVEDGYYVKGTSTLYDPKTGEAKLEWVKTNRDEQRQFQLQVEAVTAAVSRVQVRKRVKKPKIERDDLMIGIPIGDQHNGMYAWGEETLGDDWDTEKAADLLRAAFDYLIDEAPSAHTCLIAVMGDYFHYDSMESVTPTNKHHLDADTRYKQMAESGVDALCHCIDGALEKFARVHVILEPGNHDPLGILWLQIALRRLYKNNPRVTIDQSPAHFHYYRFGKVLIGTHHGDGKAAKFNDLPEIMAHDCQDQWSETRYRHWWTGHIHTRKIEDRRTCTIESLRILAPGDAYAAHNGYRARRDLQAIVFHKEFGERWRYNVTPEMLA